MAVTGFFDRVVQALFRAAGGAPEEQAEPQLFHDVIDMIVETVEPRVRMHPRYREKLQALVRATVRHLRTLGATVAAPLLLSR